MTDVILDLWGDPIPPKPERRGRPIHEVTDEKRLRVAVLRAFNMAQPEIAEAMGISVPTLRKNYFRELRDGLAQKRAEALVKLWQEVSKGNVSAIKTFLKQVERADMLTGAIVGRMPEKEKKKPKLGKKEQAVADALVPDATSTMGNLMADRMSAVSGKPN